MLLFKNLGAVRLLNFKSSSNLLLNWNLPSNLKLRPASHRQRFFTTSNSLHLIYKRAVKIKKTPESMDDTNNIIKNAKTVSDIEDIGKIKLLSNNKYYKKTPLLLKPYMRAILLRPAAFIISIAILQQVLSIIPFLLLWYIYDNFELNPPKLPQDLLVKGVEMMHNGLVNWDETQGDKEMAVLAGASAYAVIKILGPLIWISAIALAPFFDQFVIRSLGRVLGRLFKRKAKFSKENVTPAEFRK